MSDSEGCGMNFILKIADLVAPYSTGFVLHRLGYTFPCVISHMINGYVKQLHTELYT